jgi:plasmid stability protein
MAQLVLQGLDDVVQERLRRRAARNGHSVEEEVREILGEAVASEEATEESSDVGLGTRISRRFAGLGEPPFVIEEIRTAPMRPTPFEEYFYVGDDDFDEDEDSSR